jgi:hypothetical protein
MADIVRHPGGPEDPASIEDVERTPRIVVIAAAAVVFVVGITNFALGQVGLGVAAVSVGLLVFGAGLSWLTMERRRIRQAEREWLIDRPGEH